MKKQLILTVCAVVAACDSPVAPVAGPQYSNGGGNPQFAEEATWCAVAGEQVSCEFKVTGLGRVVETFVELTVDAREEYVCANPQGKVVKGQGERVRVGSASGLYRSEKNGRVDSRIGAVVDWGQDYGARPCASGHSVVAGSVVLQTLWELRATGDNKAGSWVAVYAPVQ